MGSDLIWEEDGWGRGGTQCQNGAIKLYANEEGRWEFYLRGNYYSSGYGCSSREAAQRAAIAAAREFINMQIDFVDKCELEIENERTA